MRSIFRGIVLFAIGYFLGTQHVFGMPSPRGYVTDEAQILGSDRNSLERRISEYHKQTGVEIAVVTVQTLEGRSVEEYANLLFHTWGIGKKGQNNGLLILIAVKEHKTRIEVGYGLESKLTDGFCGDVIRDDMVPAFKHGQFGTGVHNALTTLLKRLGDR